MRNVLIGTVLAGFMGTAAAAGDELSAGDGYSAKAFYRVEFGRSQPVTQSVGLRFDNSAAERRNVPAFFQAQFAGEGLPVLQLQGVTVAGPAAKLGATGGGWMSTMGPGQWAAIGLTGAFAIGIAAAANSNTDFKPAAGSGTGG